MKRIISQLKGVGHPVDDFNQSFQLLRYLPPQYEGIIQIIYRWSDTRFKFDKVLEELLAEESRLKQRHEDQMSVALFWKPKLPAESRESVSLRGSPNQRKPIKATRIGRVITCFRCQKSGHYKNQCPELQWKKGKKQIFKETNSKFNETSYVTEAYGCNEELDDAWVFDSAATTHFCQNRQLFTDFQAVKNQAMAVAVNGVTCPIEGKGTVKLLFGNECIVLRNVFYSPKLRRNLLAGPRFDDGNAKFVGEKGEINVFNDLGRKLFTARKINGLYLAYPRYPVKFENDVSASLSQLDVAKIWHRRLAHVNSYHLRNTSKLNCVKGLPKLPNEFPICEPCQEAKNRRVSFKPIMKIRSKRPLELIHMDVCGPLPKPSIQGHKYFLTIIDDFSRKVIAYPLKNKSEVFSIFERFQKRAERFLDSKILSVRTDNGLEFANDNFKALFEKQGIKAERTNAYAPEQNGISERFNYTAVDGIKVLLRDSGLSEGFWAEALLHFVYTWNRVCHREKQLKTPFELYSGKQPSVSHLRPFGTKVYVGVPKQLRKKFDMRAKKGVLVG